MTTMAQLVKSARLEFTPALEKIGFIHHGKLCFSMVNSEGIHKTILSSLSYGENLTFYVTCFVKEYAPHKMKNFPYNINYTSGGELGENLLCGELWEVDSLDNINLIFKDILSNITLYALPWFEKINTRQDYVNAMTADAKERAEDNDRMEAILTPPLDEQ